MNVLKRPILALSIMLLHPLMGYADYIGQSISLTGDLFGRSQPDFISKSNIDYVVPSGSQGTVLETVELPSGSLGVRVRISQVNDNRGSTTIQPGQETWIYYSKTQPLFSLNEINPSNSPPIPNTGRYRPPQIRPYEELDRSQDPNLPITNNRYQTEADFCTDCTPGRTPQTEQNNQSALRRFFSRIGSFVRRPRTNSQATSAPTQSTDLAPPTFQSRPAVTNSATSDSSSAWRNFPEVTKFSNDPRTLTTIADATRNISNGRTEKGYCYRAVKKALFKNYTSGSAYNSQLPGGNARDGVRDLKRIGWKNMLDDPRYASVLKGDYHNAPKGSIIVYSNGTNSGYPGHIEIKNSDGSRSSFLSFYTGYNFLTSGRAAQLASQGKPLKVIGVMIKTE